MNKFEALKEIVDTCKCGYCERARLNETCLMCSGVGTVVPMDLILDILMNIYKCDSNE